MLDLRLAARIIKSIWEDVTANAIDDKNIVKQDKYIIKIQKKLTKILVNKIT